jgi:geranylgeranyl pyrophosphate synthase
MNLSWEGTLDSFGALIEDRLKNFLDEALKEAEEYHPFIRNVYADLEEFALRKGKRLASCSTLLAYKGYSGKVDDRILDVCVGIELYRHAILVHDDLVDMDNMRRGGNTLHQKFMKSYEPYTPRFGEGTAIFAGNIAYSLALKSIIDSDFPGEKVSKVSRLLSDGYREVNESQILDLLFESKDVGVDEWVVMAGKRAASLFKVTMLTGAVLGDAPKKDHQMLGEAAENMGYSFDIQDDIIDCFAPKDKYGRPPCLDIAKSKKPLHVIYALNSLDRTKAEALKCLLGKANLNRGDIELVRTLLRESGGLDVAKKISRKHAEKARASLTKTSLNNEAKEFFNSFISYIDESLDWYK